MARPADGLKVITANRLDSGAVVWFGPGDAWGHRIAAATVFETPEQAEAALERAKAAVEGGGKAEAGEVVEPYLIEVTLVDGAPRPLRPREQIRSLGPSVRADLGVQAGRQQ